MLVPFKLEVERERIPAAVFVLVTLSSIIFLAQQKLGLNQEEFYVWGGLVPAVFSWKTTFTALFLHGGWLHLVGNMFFLWFFGRSVEDRFGHAGFLLFYISAGLVSGWIHTVNVSSRFALVPCIGASGAISGVLGAFLVLFPYAKVRCFFVSFLLRHGTFIDLPALIMLGAWFSLQLFGAYVASEVPEAVPVAFGAHIGGFLYGAALTMALFRGLPVARRWKQGIRQLKIYQALINADRPGGTVSSRILVAISPDEKQFAVSRIRLGDRALTESRRWAAAEEYQAALSFMKSLADGEKLALFYRLRGLELLDGLEPEKVMSFGNTLLRWERYDDALLLFFPAIEVLGCDDSAAGILFLAGEALDLMGRNDFSRWVFSNCGSLFPETRWGEAALMRE